MAMHRNKAVRTKYASGAAQKQGAQIREDTARVETTGHRRTELQRVQSKAKE